MNRENRYRGDDKVSGGKYSNIDRGLVNERRDDQSLRLSQFNESLIKRDSTSMKFEWKHLLGEPAKSVTDDKYYSLTKTNVSDGYGVNDTRLTSDRKHYQESVFLGLGGLERKLVSHNPEPGIGLSSCGLDESIVYKPLAREPYNKLNLNCTVGYSEDDTYCTKQSVGQSNDYGTGSLALPEKRLPVSFTGSAHISYGRDRLDAKMSDSTVIHDGHGRNVRGNSHVTRISPNHITVQGRHDNYAYVEGWRIKKENVFSLSDDLHTNASVYDRRSHGCLPVTSNLDSTINQCCYEELSRESRVRYDDHYLQGKKIRDDSDMKTSHIQEQDKKVLDCTSAHASCERELYCNRRSPRFGEDHESLNMLPLGEYGQQKVNYDHEGLLLEEDYGYVRSETFPSIENDVLDETVHTNDYGRGSLALGEKELPESFARSDHISSSGEKLDSQMINSTVQEGHGHNLRGNSHVTRISPHHIPVQGKHEDYTYGEGWEFEKENVFSLSDDLHTNASVHNHHSQDCLPVTGNLVSTVGRTNECCYEEVPRESRVRYDDRYLQGKKIPGDNDMKTAYTREQDKEVLDCTSTHAICTRELYCDRRSPPFGDDHESLKMLPLEYGQHKVNYDHEGLLLEEDYGYVRSETLLSEENDVFDDTAGDFQQKLAAAECYSTDQSKLTLKRKHGIYDIPRDNYIGKTISGDGERGVGNYYQGVAVEESTAEDMAAFVLSKKLSPSPAEDMAAFALSKKPRPSHSQLPQTERVYYETTNNLSSSSDLLLPPEDLYVSVPRCVHLHNSGSRDIQKRLGPRPQDYASQLHPPAKTSKSSVKKRLGAVEQSKPSVRQRLGPIPKVVLTEDPGMKKGKSKKLCQRIFHDYNVHVRKEELSDADVIPTIGETHENSKEFKQLVDSAYFRLVKQLNENASQRRRILEQGKAGSLNCIICGSASKEFVDTKILVMHAFYSQKVGFRSQHLGYHRALCMLMGWRSKMADGCPWFCELLSDTEASSLKEDLIIWPPVVMIHNSSLINNDFDGRIIVSVEALESILRGMGFYERIKVFRGRPANNSIMVVKFNSTLSGLQAAERLHNLYSEIKHGKADFENISSCSNSYTGEAPMTLEKKMEHVLYGYLGIADDLDKLDFETKKRCLVKSKKEIQRIAEHSW